MKVNGIDDLIAQLQATSALAAGRTPAAPQTAPEAADFTATLKAAIDDVNQAQNKAAGLAREYELGNPKVNLHEAMLSLQKANVAFQGMVQVRNRLVSAYQTLMNMQV